MTRLLVFQALFAGTCFGIYPLLLDISRIDGNLRAAVFTLVCLLSMAPFVLQSGLVPLASANWWALVAAGVLGGAGLLQMNRFFAGAPTQDVSTMLFVVMQVTTIVLVALNYLRLNGWSVPIDKAIGLAGAPVIVWLLLRR